MKLSSNSESESSQTDLTSTTYTTWEDEWSIYIISGVVGLFIIVSLILLYFCCYSNWARRRKEQNVFSTNWSSYGTINGGDAPIPLGGGGKATSPIRAERGETVVTPPKPEFSFATVLQQEPANGTTLSPLASHLRRQGVQPAFGGQRSFQGVPPLSVLSPSGSVRSARGVAGHPAVSKGGLLQRRTSGQSLTIDLSPSATTTVDVAGRQSPDPIHTLRTASNCIHRRDLRNFVRITHTIRDEFSAIPMNLQNRVVVDGSKIKNRYSHFIPNEATRVLLPADGDDPLSTYINANYVTGYAGADRAYIATQGPLPTTFNDFWRMIWAEQPAAIVQITNQSEIEKQRCEDYLPPSGSRIYGTVRATICDVQEHPAYTERTILLSHVDFPHPSTTLTVTHFWIHSWPDHHAPESAHHIIQLILTVEKHRTDEIQRRLKLSWKAKRSSSSAQKEADRRNNNSASRDPPIAVHCSAGIGRTGCFIACSVGIQRLIRESKVDVLAIVSAMRLCRGGMVQTCEQYEFIYHTLSIFADNQLTLYQQQLSPGSAARRSKLRSASPRHSSSLRLAAIPSGSELPRSPPPRALSLTEPTAPPKVRSPSSRASREAAKSGSTSSDNSDTGATAAGGGGGGTSESQTDLEPGECMVTSASQRPRKTKSRLTRAAATEYERLAREHRRSLKAGDDIIDSNGDSSESQEPKSSESDHS